MPDRRVALIQGDDRYRNVTQALEAIAPDIDLQGKRRILIKPNFVSVHRALCATHVDAMRAVLDFLRARGVGRVTLAFGPASGTPEQGMRNYGYLPLLDEYDLEVVNLNEDTPVEVEALDRHLRPLRLRVARTMLESDLRISVSPPKTHDMAIVTLSLKNMAVGALVRGEKSRIHQNTPAIQLNLYKMAAHVAPHLTVLDGYQAMEGNGPVSGDPVDWRIAIASADFVAADALAASLMGFPYEQVGYLYYCQLKGLGQADVSQMQIVGNVQPDQVRRAFKPHRNIKGQLAWHLPDAERYL
jgi:uncharacterized protein (DUF362 family)